MARKRFNAAEKRLIAEGTDIEWLHGSHWQPARVTDPTIVTEDGGYQHVEGEHAGRTTRTISKGARLWLSPGHIRARGGPS